MAVSQVEALKKPFRLWMWKMLVAAQPPSSAPAMPIRQVRMRPCCLLPGIAMLASRPAPDPPQLGDPGGSRGGHDQRAGDGGEEQRDRERQENVQHISRIV